MCKKSESIVNLAVSLAKFNMNVQRIEKDGTNPHFKNRYTTLDAILDEVRPMLAEQGLSVIQMPSGDGEQLKLTTMLIHITGEWIESDPINMRPAKNDPQGVGSATTYARRYSLCAFLGLSTGDVDDDGNSASQPPRTQQSAPTPQSHKTPPVQTQTPTSQPASSGGLISENQIKYAHKLKNDKRISEEDFHRMIAEYGADSIKDLTKSSASQFINLLTNYAA